MTQEDKALLKKPDRIGILGGTFDPIHYGHLYIAEQVREVLDLTHIIFVPNYVSPHKTEHPVTETRHRVEMVRLAIEGNAAFRLSTLETDRHEPSYTIDTIQAFQAEAFVGTTFYLITGADVFLYFHTWKEYERVLKLVKLAIVTREGYNQQLDEKIKYFTETYQSDIMKLELPSLEISSTFIRNQLEAGKSVRYLLPPQVEAYMKKEGLYKR